MPNPKTNQSSKFLSASIALSVALCLTAIMTPVAYGQTYTDLYDFGSNPGDPEGPKGFVVQGTDGNFYGTAWSGATNGQGGVFSMTPAGAPTLLLSFINDTPGYGLSLHSDGNFYGVTQGKNPTCTPKVDCGTLFSITPSGTYTLIHAFLGGPDGHDPLEPPIEGYFQNFFGTTTRGGFWDRGTGYSGGRVVGNRGDAGPELTVFDPGPGVSGLFFGISADTVFEATALGKSSVVHNFGEGFLPTALILGSDARLYGTTFYGGQASCNGGFGCGIVFKINPDGVYAVVHRFTATEGRGPTTLIEGSDGSLYGTTATDAVNNAGTIFKIAADGTFSVIHKFDQATGQNPTGLVQGTDGVLYGITQDGGSANGGVFFSLDLGLPTFSRLLPSWGAASDTIGILGQGFTAASGVLFNGVPSSFTVVSDDYITAQVPSGVTTGSVTVTTPTGTLTSITNFQVIQEFYR
jgi:uncharacterized repeat protein (TIGR03803 family)